MQYLNQEEHRNLIFLWLNDLLNHLKVEEVEWKRENGFLIEPEPEVETAKNDLEEEKKGSESDEDEPDHTHEEDGYKRKRSGMESTVTV